MRKILVGLIAASVMALGMALPGGAGADPSGTCPNGHNPYLVLFDESGTAARKDRNNNGIVCRKYDPSNPTDPGHGGPDDRPPTEDELLDDVI